MTNSTPAYLVSGLLAFAIAGCAGNRADAAGRERAVSARIASSSASLTSTQVPSGYEETAVGFIHSSCVIELAEDEQELQDGSIQAADGTVRMVPPCPYPWYDTEGNEYPPEATENPAPAAPPSEDPTPEDPAPQDPTPEDPAPQDPTPEYPAPQDPAPEDPGPEDPTPEYPAPQDPAPEDPAPEDPASAPAQMFRIADAAGDAASLFKGWLAYVFDSSNGPFSYFAASWTVPSEPTARSGQRLAYFPGLENLASGHSVLQPVLRWFAAQGGWSVLTEHCCHNGNAVFGRQIPVKAGDKINASITGVNCAANGVCSEWLVYAMDQTTGQSSTLRTSSYGQVFDAAAIALEGFDMTQCADHSATGGIVYTGITAIGANGVVPRFNWKVGASDSKSPCHERPVVADANTSTVMLITDTR